MIMFWCPFQLISLSFILCFAHMVFKVDPLKVRLHSLELYYGTLILQGYFFLVILRDSMIFAVEFTVGEHFGFWKALFMHYIALPVDSFILLALSIYCYVNLTDPRATECNNDDECREFMEPMELNAKIGIIYVFCNFFAKCWLFWLFMYVCGGQQMLEADIAERDRLLNTKSGEEVFNGLQTNSYSNIIA